MNRLSHIVIGVVSAEVTCAMAGMSVESLECIKIGVVSGIAATIPDIDLKFRLIMKHRTWTHSLLLCGITVAIIMQYSKYLSIIWGIGYLSHLIADSLTVMGVPFLYPFIKKKYGLKIL